MKTNEDLSLARIRRVEYLLNKLATKKNYTSPAEVEHDIHEALTFIREDLEERDGTDDGTKED